MEHEEKNSLRAQNCKFKFKMQVRDEMQIQHLTQVTKIAHGLFVNELYDAVHASQRTQQSQGGNKIAC
jgi:hypothetical protein